jgi:hypothetical protein
MSRFLQGWIRDAVQTYVITLHILNVLTYATAVAWTVERYLTNRKKSKVEIKINGEHKVAT